LVAQASGLWSLPNTGETPVPLKEDGRAKNLSDAAGTDEILRFAQDDSKAVT